MHHEASPDACGDTSKSFGGTAFLSYPTMSWKPGMYIAMVSSHWPRATLCDETQLWMCNQQGTHSSLALRAVPGRGADVSAQYLVSSATGR